VTGTLSPAAASAPERLRQFLVERAPARVYLTYAVTWVLGLQSVVALAAPPDTRWILGMRTLCEILSVYLALVFARIVDEQKDLAYDREHNPERPLPRGAVSVVELRVTMVFIVAAETLLNAWQSPLLLGLILLFLAYDCFLVRLERWSRTLRDSMFRNLAVTYPVQILLSVHIWLACTHTGPGLPVWTAVLATALGASVFLHFEFARKTGRSLRPGAALYSNVVGCRGAVLLTVAMPVMAVATVITVVAPWSVHGVAAFAAWVPVSAAAFVWQGAEQFVTLRRPTWPPLPAMGFLAWLYGGLFVAALFVAHPLLRHP
jgi:4-hydroxybenzoate polyprenyltransferase